MGRAAAKPTSNVRLQAEASPPAPVRRSAGAARTSKSVPKSSTPIKSASPTPATVPGRPATRSSAAKALQPKRPGGVAGRTRRVVKSGAPASLPPAVVAEMFRRFAAANPEPKGELEHVNAYTLLVAVVLSAQATDAGVNKATRGLFAVADTAEKMVALGEDKVRDLIRTIGLFRTKAKNVILLSADLVAKHGGEVPRDREALEALAGVGRKTANVVLNSAFGEPTIAVDTHLFRLSNRLSLAPGKTPLEVEQKLLATIPPEYLLFAHHWLILHGRYVCKAQRPACQGCLISDLCTAPDKTIP